MRGPYDPRVPPTVKFSQESESARLTKIILSKNTVKNFLNTSTVEIENRIFSRLEMCVSGDFFV